MGEIFLVHDPICKRQVALKQILPKLRNHPVIRSRFLREAEVGALLNHPSILPVFSIDPSHEKLYYTMPYIEGETLKQILKRCLEEEKETNVLLPLFLKLCEAVEYAHAKKIIHRDIKPDNILVGHHGEVLLFDWGLSDFEGSSTQEIEVEESKEDLTSPGKVPGTLNYIAPERLQGAQTSASMDIYSLGVILYQILTLRSPFQRKSLKLFKQCKEELLIPPIERAPHRSIPESLNALCIRCLHPDPKERIGSVKEMIDTLFPVLNGLPQPVKITHLNPFSSQDWEFQEHIFLSQHLAITKSPQVAEWAHLMVSLHHFIPPLNITLKFSLPQDSQGIALLLGVPSLEERKSFVEGVQIFLGKTSLLLLHGAPLMLLPGANITDTAFHTLTIEYKDHKIHVSLDGKQVGLYPLRLPLPGQKIGFFSYDSHFAIETFVIEEKGHTLNVSCLEIPHAFLSHRDFKKGRIEYERIASSFPGTLQEKEALFGAGICLIEERQPLLALEMFDRLHNTSYAPLEYVGKSLVYKQEDIEEEMKCLELALRKYKNHPLIHTVQEQLILRLYETSFSSRRYAYEFALIALMHIPCAIQDVLFSQLNEHLASHPLLTAKVPADQALACKCALYTGKIHPLLELSESGAKEIRIDACYALLLLGTYEEVEENLPLLEAGKEEILSALSYFKEGPKAAFTKAGENIRLLYFLLQRCLMDSVYEIPPLPKDPLLDSLLFFMLRRQGKSYPIPETKDPASPLFIPYAYQLLDTQGKEAMQAHLALAPAFSIASLLLDSMQSSQREKEWLLFEKTLVGLYTE
ncbi:MAG: serine/threonine-protein kinase pknD [Chlamydiota bacterium]